jgi:hypothetical protein
MSQLQSLPGPGRVAISKLPVGTYMRANLGGAAFEAQLIGQELQPLPSDDVAEWAWKVKPLEAGTWTLRLTLYVELGAAPLSNKTYDRRIEIRVAKATKPSLFHRVLNWSGWQPIAVGVLLAAITGYGKRWINKHWPSRAAASVRPSPAPDNESPNTPATAPTPAAQSKKRPAKSTAAPAKRRPGEPRHKS